MPGKQLLFITREIVPFYYGGIGTLFKAIAKLLAGQGHHVSFLTQARQDFDRDLFVAEYGDLPVYFVSSPDEDAYIDYSPSGGVVSTFNLAYAIAVTREFEQLAPKIKPNIVFSADYGAEALFLLLRSGIGDFSGIRFVLHFSGGLYDALTTYEGGTLGSMPSELDEPRNRMLGSMEDCCYLLADDIITPTALAWQQTADRLQINRPVSVIPNLPDRDLFLLKPRMPKTNNGEKIFLFIGRLDRHKGADLLLRTFFAFQREKGSDVRLVFLGRNCFCKEYDSTFLDYWQDKIPAELQHQIEFAGQVDHTEVSRYLGKACVCLFPSRWEVFGIVCLEAMCYGVPVLVARNTGLAEMLGEELAGFAVDFEEEQVRIFSLLQELLSSSDDNRQLRHRLRCRAEEIVSTGETLYKALADTIETKQIGEERKNARLLYEKMFDVSAAVSDIAFFLGKDLQKVKQAYNLDDDSFKELVQGVHQPTPGKMGRLKSWVGRHLNE